MNVLLVCYAGMSTSIMMKKMEEYAKTKDIELNINAVPLSELPQFVDENTSIVILGPQIRFSAKEVEKTLEGKIPYMVIETRDYGMMRGDLVLEQAIKKIESFHAQNNKSERVSQRFLVGRCNDRLTD